MIDRVEVISLNQEVTQLIEVIKTEKGLKRCITIRPTAASPSRCHR